MSMMPVDAGLHEFGDSDYTPRLVGAIFKVVPYSPVLVPYHALEDAVKAIKPGATAIDIAQARQISASKDIQAILWMARIMDTADSSYAAFTGLKMAFNWARGAADALDTDSAQATDAALKAIGLAYMAYHAFPGTVAEKTEAFRTLPAAQALAVYYASVEIALPFTDNVLSSGGHFLDKLFNAQLATQASRLATLGGGQSMTEAVGLLQSMKGNLQKVVDHSVKYAEPVAHTAKQYLPAAMGAADKVAGVVAEAVDVMPVYRYLGARLAAEASAWRVGR